MAQFFCPEMASEAIPGDLIENFPGIGGGGGGGGGGGIPPDPP